VVRVKHFPERKPKAWRAVPAGGSTRAWRELRAQALERDGYRCTAHLADGTRCPRRAAEVHHLTPGHGPIVEVHELASVCIAHHPKGTAS
jgi:hypothetical protein